MQPLHPNPQDFVGANLRRAYRGTPPQTLPDRLEELMARLAAKLDSPPVALVPGPAHGRSPGQQAAPPQRAMAGQRR